jgi:lipid II:glycine glycyltransferase (peptidoglycan interpeptide bridge formation enzyme)
MQSWEWGELARQSGNQIVRVGDIGNGEISAVATLIKKSLGWIGSYFYAPRGPIIKTAEKSVQPDIDHPGVPLLQNFFSYLKVLASQDRIIFFRFELADNEKMEEFFGYRNDLVKTLDIQPSQTLLLNLSTSDNELLAAMHPKTRYNIRLAQKKGVTVRPATPAEFSLFWDLAQTTARRDGFHLHPRDHYERLFTFSDCIKLYVAEAAKKIIAANIVSFFGDTATYLHGASANISRDLMAPYALQWEVIKFARRSGYKFYDFYGIDDKKWPGVTRYKKGFGGEIKIYPGTHDLVLLPAHYRLYRALRWLRRKI